MIGVEFVKAIFVGICGSIPVGPVAVLCIQRTLNKGKTSGIISGAGAAVADTIFAAFAILGLAIVQRLLENNESYFLIAGGAILVALGVKVYFTNPIVQLRKSRAKKGRFVEDFVSVFLLTISNPATVFFLIGLLALVNLNLSKESGGFSIAMVLWGVCIGAFLWWFSLVSLVNRFRKKFRLKQLWITNRISGIVIFVAGFISLVDGIWLLLFK